MEHETTSATGFTTKILEQQNSFRCMQQKLQEKHIKSHFRYPAKLRNFWKESQQTYDSIHSVVEEYNKQFPEEMERMNEREQEFQRSLGTTGWTKIQRLVREIWTTGSSTF